MDKEKITDRYTKNAKDFDQIVVDTFKIIEGKNELIKELRKRNNGLEKSRGRLLTLATKHCPQEHHDWSELLDLAEEK